VTPPRRRPRAAAATDAGALRGAPGAACVRKGWPLFAIFVLLVVAVAAVAGPSLAPKDPNRQNIIVRLQPPMVEDRAGVVQFPLGTDALGRDVLSRLIYGARVSLLVGLTAVLIGGTLGIALGMIAGYFGGRVGRRHHAPRRHPARVPVHPAGDHVPGRAGVGGPQPHPHPRASGSG
jgi:ABC-type dipeptide/oligopeptide/nickel transport system permease subunit